MKKAIFFLFVISLSLQFQIVQAGVVYKKNQWKKTQIRICFLDSQRQALDKVSDDREEEARAFQPITKNNIYWHLAKETISEAFNPKDTFVHFVGWELCSETVRPDAVFFYYSLDPGQYMAGFGSRSLARTTPFGKKMPSIGVNVQLIDNVKDRMASLKATLLHEFGHLAGLGHEHDHPRAVFGMSCIRENMFSDACPAPRSSDRNLYLGEYDDKSVMGHCQLKKIKGGEVAAALSDGDRSTLRSLFQNLSERTQTHNYRSTGFLFSE